MCSHQGQLLNKSLACDDILHDAVRLLEVLEDPSTAYSENDEKYLCQRPVHF